jgi:[ribosomal protein S5]-alanine N-acetyltransferase
MKIETDRLELVPLTADQLLLWELNSTQLENDLNCVYRGEPLVGRFKDIVHTQERTARGDRSNYLWHTFWFIIRKEDRVVVGSSDFKDIPDADGQTEIGYGLENQFEHNGYMTETVTAMCRWAFCQPDVRRIIAETYLDNSASQHVLKRCGFSEFKHDQSIWWKLDRNQVGIGVENESACS